jgi:hypothetical protein
MKAKTGIVALALASLIVVSVAVFAAAPESSKSDSAVWTIKLKGAPVAVMTLKFPGVQSGAYPEIKADHCVFDSTSGAATYRGNFTIRLHGVNQSVFEIKADEVSMQGSRAK